MRVRLEDARDLHAAPRRLLEIRLDAEGGVDDNGETGRLVADQVGPAAEVVVDELAEQHEAGPYQRARAWEAARILQALC
jgi:hypothetical protein